ncbi:MarR family transcriptional regulator [Natronorubrum sp. JWXQ-INN-674]|uniref:MarR family transcriptional regulator n=1 Tax=Natronorubrum halalkaliphilum TaxID=2691917 RepID=A0A6B0VRZ3_9EURY|nr:MarR family transcriptional regulator [Natronorubrum halalkaliphilum]MXV63279.1 MarR family transcriptional regulator [Natronorubrum halalkaliphilum]
MIEQVRANNEISQLPTDLASPQGKLVYLYLEATGGATVDELGQVLTMKKIAILSVCNSLSSQGLIEKRDGEYVPRP